MRKWIHLAFMTLCFFCLSGIAVAASAVTPDGYFNGIRLAGKVRVVDSFPDIRVQVVSAFPDLRVQTVDYFPDDIGQWQFVDYGEDFTVQFVDSFPDIRIQFVNSFPGIP
ncbi:MAG: hypothetical protein ACI4N8_00550 [Megasphaera sp.]|uniref:hypothetical protein n=1 Tax=Megasphaera sp. TaxID=2023260 RepID=UPI003EFC4421